AALPALAAGPGARRAVGRATTRHGDACARTFCAGAARGDITPPVTTPMWGYTAREAGLVVADQAQTAGDRLGKGDPAGAAEATVAVKDRPVLADKLSADPEGYCKTFNCNQGVQSRLFANA